ncbi:GNAT family N-acetyltransferase [Pseudoalteromonas luteoviolacea]|uniref:GNAT family N-acetyltransferase n=1 Tax=Pseudoalteromonas luteoviolacea TaxID=43657 RepID=UPI00163B66BE|nr:GNAT family N-acetyltransferase [Pseudoalteromonas luteoviolacea]
MVQFTIPEGLHIRPSTASDKPFIEKLHREVRQDLQCIDGEQDFIESIVDMQLKAQTQGYGAQYPNAMYFIIEKHNEPIGKATLDFGHNEIRLIDIGFLIAARGHGFGRAIIQSFQHCAAQSAVPLTLSVLSHNLSVKRLYLELGFQVSEVQPPYELMIWYPPAMKSIVGV